jgi:hypothetical protein
MPLALRQILERRGLASPHTEFIVGLHQETQKRLCRRIRNVKFQLRLTRPDIGIVYVSWLNRIRGNVKVSALLTVSPRSDIGIEQLCVIVLVEER